jgi:hypothetical protein
MFILLKTAMILAVKWRFRQPSALDEGWPAEP